MMNGLYVAIPFGMTNSAAIHRNRGIASVVRVVRAFAEASIVALAFGLAILVIAHRWRSPCGSCTTASRGMLDLGENSALPLARW